MRAYSTQLTANLKTRTATATAQQRKLAIISNKLFFYKSNSNNTKPMKQHWPIKANSRVA